MKKYIVLISLLTINYIAAQNTAGNYEVKNLKINTEYADFGTTFLGKDKVVFSSPKKINRIIRNIWKPNSQPYLDLYSGSIDKESGEIVDKEKIKGNINLKFHEAQVAFTNDLKTVYFTGNNFYNNKVKNDATGTLRLQLFKASVNDKEEWVNIEKLPFNNDEFSTGHPSLSKNGKLLYFVSDRPGSIGKSDIYYVTINEDGNYGEPVNLGSKINTPKKEMFPFISDDNILYFSSIGHSGNGKLDVFASKILENSVSKPINLGTQINSTEDDFAFIINTNNTSGYFSSNRNGGYGDDDIYNFKVISPINIECNQQVTGVIRNKDTQELMPQTTVSLLDKNGNKINEIVVDDSASYNFTLPCNTPYTIVVNTLNFITTKIDGITGNKFDASPIKTNLSIAQELKKINEKIVANINPIYFDLDKWTIQPNAAIELDKVIEIMKKNPSIIIEAISHTDARANDLYNQKLSDKRAKATIDYIISKGGIDPNRLKSKGLGEAELLNKCSNNVYCTGVEHQLNRRTEFVLVNEK